MKIIRWLISNFFLILLIVVVIYAYMFWGNLTGRDTPAGQAIAYLSREFKPVDEFVTAVRKKQETLSSERAASQVDESATTTTDTVAAAEPVAVSEPLQSAPVTISYSHNQTLVKQNSAGVTEMKRDERAVAAVPPVSEPSATKEAMATAMVDEHQQPAVPAPATAATGVIAGELTSGSDAAEGSAEKVPDATFVPESVSKQLDNVDDHGHVIDPSVQSDDVRATWIKARKSFYQRNYALSEKSYLKVIADTEDNFDAYGELGNVYFNQGKKAQAAAAYYEAAAILIRKGQVQRVKSLMGLMRHLDKKKAEALQKLIDATQKEAA